MQRFGVVLVNPPARPPRGATLLRSANPAGEPDTPQWVQGLLWQPDACGNGDIVKATGICGSFGGFADPADRPEQVEYVPMIVAVGQNCGAIVGQNVLDETTARARDLLERCATVGIARELWRGDIAKNTDDDGTDDLPNLYLAQDGVVDELAAAAVPVRDAFALLEQGLAECSCGGVGMIHAAPYTATLWSSLDLIERQPDGRLVSALGTIVVADPGYDGSAPDGTAHAANWGDAWAYATSMVDVRLGAVETTGDAQSLGFATNDFEVYAYRPFAATFDPCCHLGVQIDHTDRS